MFNLDYITEEYMKQHNRNWPDIPDHLYRIQIVGGSGSRKANLIT